MCTIKPIDREALISAARETQAIFTVEDHNIIGGLGSSVLESLDGERAKVVRIGINDCFGRSGKREELAEKFCLTPDAIADRIMSEL
jgi:transketolase